LAALRETGDITGAKYSGKIAASRFPFEFSSFADSCAPGTADNSALLSAAVTKMPMRAAACVKQTRWRAHPLRGRRQAVRKNHFIHTVKERRARCAKTRLQHSPAHASKETFSIRIVAVSASVRVDGAQGVARADTSLFAAVQLRRPNTPAFSPRAGSRTRMRATDPRALTSLQSQEDEPASRTSATLDRGIEQLNAHEQQSR
jgi:hypothetical protein